MEARSSSTKSENFQLRLKLPSYAFAGTRIRTCWRYSSNPCRRPVIAATNRDLQAAISAGSFRMICLSAACLPIEMPSLRERREDIPLLVEYFIDRYARKAGKNIKRVNKKTLELLQLYPWREHPRTAERHRAFGDTLRNRDFHDRRKLVTRPQPLTPESNSKLSFLRDSSCKRRT